MPQRGDPRVVAVLAALARGALGDGYTAEIPERMLSTTDQLASDAQRSQILGVLRAAGSRVGALALTGRPTPVSWLSRAEAERVLQGWANSRFAFQRQLASTIISLSLSSLYAYPGPEWERIGYPGPLGPPHDVPNPIEPLTLDHDEVIDCDVVLVGSGAGGGCVADHLAAQGFDVVVLEKGNYYGPRDFTHLEPEATRNMYLYGMTLATSDLGCRIIAGSTLGGGTVVNYTTSFKTPPHVLRQWAEQTGIDAFTSGEIEGYLDEMAERVDVNTDSSAAGKRDALMEEGLKKLGWHVDMMPRSVKGCTQDEQCGYCGFGCRVGAKASRTLLQTAAENGARLVVGVDVRRIKISDGRATGVEGVTSDGHRITVNARAVVATAGSIETPALLLRSGLGGKVGHYLHLHPGVAAFGIFDDDVRVWEGTLQARYSDEIRDRDGGYGPIFETVPAHPGAGSTTIPWLSAAQHRKAMEDYKKISFVAALPRDETCGRIKLTRDGSPRVTYKLTPGDERRIADGVIAAAKVVEAAGAREIFSPHPGSISYRPGTSGGHERWAEETRRAGYANGAVTFFSFHQMGSCRMGVDPTTSAVGPDNESHEVRDLFVADSSTFPTASGVNPMLSIYGIAKRAANKIAARLG
ncbi:MAG: GMC family oxidoreductase N-terminal domain-containing protein [Actinomycetota bacterium]